MGSLSSSFVISPQMEPKRGSLVRKAEYGMVGKTPTS